MKGVQRISIDRLDLDLRGIDRGLAEAAVQLLGSALEARLSGEPSRMPAPGAADAHALAHHLADRVATQLNSTPSPKAEHHAARRTGPASQKPIQYEVFSRLERLRLHVLLKHEPNGWNTGRARGALIAHHLVDAGAVQCRSRQQ